MYCEPERLQALQRIFDTISRYAPRDRECVRDAIARMVMDQADCEMTDQEITSSVLDQMDLKLSRGQRQKVVVSLSCPREVEGGAYVSNARQPGYSNHCRDRRGKRRGSGDEKGKLGNRWQ
jgi:hypothetical protein